MSSKRWITVKNGSDLKQIWDIAIKWTKEHQTPDPMIIVTGMEHHICNEIENMELPEKARMVAGRIMLTTYTLPNGNIIELWNIPDNIRSQDAEEILLVNYKGRQILGMFLDVTIDISDMTKKIWLHQFRRGGMFLI